MDDITFTLQTAIGIFGDELYHTVIEQGDKLLGFVRADGSIASVDWPPILEKKHD